MPKEDAALILRLPDRVFIAVTVASSKLQPKEKSTRRPAVPASSAKRLTSPTRQRTAPPLPPVLLQPNRPVTTEVKSLKLPSFIYWSASQMPPPPKPIDPGSVAGDHPGAVTRRVRPITPPNKELRPSAVSVAGGTAAKAQPPLALPPEASSGPWALIAHGEATPDAEGKMLHAAGEPLAVSSSSASPSGRKEVVEVPPVNMPGSSLRGHSGQGGQSAANGSRQENAHGVGSTSPAASTSAGASSPGTPGASANSSPGVRILNTRSGPVEVRELPDGSQQWRFPSNGSFDVVIVQHSAGATIPEAEPLLTGWPVQTVYLTLGEAKEWVMQYCVPASAGAPATQSGMVVSLAKPAKLEAPYIPD